MSKTLVFFAVVISALPVLAMAYLIWGMNSDIRAIVDSEFDKISGKVARQMAEDTLRICRMINKTQVDSSETSGAVFRERLEKLGTPRLSKDFIDVSAYPQNDRNAKVSVKTPVLFFGNVPASFKTGKDGTIESSDGAVQKILDELKADTGLEFSVFVKVDAAGDMLRIASTVFDADNKRYVGGFIPATGGRDEGEIVRTLLARKTYSGVSHTGDISFISAYEPLLNDSGEVVGAIGYGRFQNTLDYLLKYFEGMRLGANGFAWAIELVGRGESVYRISKDGKRNGQSVENDPIKERRENILEMIDTAVSQGEGKIVLREYKMNSAGRSGDDIITAFTFFKPWNMVLGATVYRGDFNEGAAVIDAASKKFIFMLVPLGILMLVFAAGTARAAAVRGVQMTRSLINASKLIERGDILDARRAFKSMMDSRQWSNAEIFELCAALNTMSANLAHLVAKVKDGGVNLAGASERISAAASEIETVAVERAVKLGELSGTINAISKSVDLLNADAVEAAKNVASSLKIIGDGEKLMGRLGENISGLLDATASVASRLAIIKDKTDRIFAVVSTINAVGNRTNTLALSAALEAERAGESAEGFSAVAAEIGRLADRTAVSSMHVSKMAGDMLESVESGVAEIENFAAGMRAGFVNMARVSDSVASTRERVSELEPKFELLARGISVHAESASNIRFAVRDLSAAASRTRESIGSLKALTDSISETSETLKDKVSRFRLPRA